MANQRAYRALNIQTQQDLEDPATKHSVGIIAAIWMDAFVDIPEWVHTLQPCLTIILCPLALL